MGKENWETILSFVQEVKGRILNKAKKFLPYSSYGLEDFFEESYLIAYDSLSECQKSCLNQNQCNSLQNCSKFLSLFWGKLRAHFYNLAHIPSEARLYNDKTKPKTPFKHVPIATTDVWEEEGYDNIIGEIIDEPEERMQDLWASLQVEDYSFLTKKEKAVLILLKDGYSVNEIQNLLSYKHKNGVIMLMNRLVEKFENYAKNELCRN